jgi:hypothetical protein
MDELVYNLLLKSAQGLTLLGTLGFRFTELGDVAGAADMASLPAVTQEKQMIELDVLGVKGTILVPLLSGPAPLPVQGVAHACPGAPTPLPLTAMLSADYSLGLGMQFNFIDATHITGGLTWRYGTSRQVIFSILGARRAFGL